MVARLPSLKRIYKGGNHLQIHAQASNVWQRFRKEQDEGISQCNLNLHNEWRKADNLFNLNAGQTSTRLSVEDCYTSKHLAE